jgi:splicing factor 3B subunit 3
MFLYSLTLNQATAINHSIQGSFTEPEQNELVLAKGKIIELLRPDDEGTLQLVFR